MRKLLVAGAVLAAACVLAPQLSQAAPNATVIAAAKSSIAPSPSIQKVYWVWAGGRHVWRPVVVVRPPVVVARPGVVVGVAPYYGRYYHRRWWHGGWRYY